jgi:hypothetical protein
MVSEQNKLDICDHCKYPDVCILVGSICLDEEAVKEYKERGEWLNLEIDEEYLKNQAKKFE